MKTALLLVIILFLQSDNYSQTYPDPGVDSTLKIGISQIIGQYYSRAEKTFGDLDKKYPQLPLGKIYFAAVQIARSYDYSEDYNEALIDSLLEAGADQSENLIEKNDNIWNRYFLSLAEGYRAYFKALNKEWLSALTNGSDALKNYEELINRDINFYEAYIAIGTFRYWKSRKTEFLEWLPGYVDEEEEGIRYLEKAIKHSTYNSYLAINSLIWIYIDQKKFSKAAELAEQALKKYPGSRFFEWGQARAFENINPEKSINIYQKILASLPGNSNHYNEIVLEHLMAQQCAKIGSKDKALKLCDDILSIKNLPENTVSRLGDRLDRVRQLKRELSR